MSMIDSHPRGRWVVWPCAALLCASAAFGETSPRAGAAAASVDDATLERLLELHHTERETVRLVLLPASVTDQRGRSVRGLAQKDFQLFESGESQSIAFFSADSNESVSIAFLLDLSGSMRNEAKLDLSKGAIERLVARLRPADRVSLIGFADRQVTTITESTADRERFLSRLAVQEAYGQTALHDAIAAAPDLLAPDGGRRAIVLLSDGMDNRSQLDAATAVALAREVKVPVYALAFSHLPPVLRSRGTGQEFEVLERVTRETGGRLFTIHDIEDLASAADALDHDLRHQYLIGYYPSRRASQGFQAIRLEVVDRRLTVRTRTGYMAEP